MPGEKPKEGSTEQWLEQNFPSRERQGASDYVAHLETEEGRAWRTNRSKKIRDRCAALRARGFDLQKTMSPEWTRRLNDLRKIKDTNKVLATRDVAELQSLENALVLAMDEFERNRERNRKENTVAAFTSGESEETQEMIANVEFRKFLRETRMDSYEVLGADFTIKNKLEFDIMAESFEDYNLIRKVLLPYYIDTVEQMIDVPGHQIRPVLGATIDRYLQELAGNESGRRRLRLFAKAVGEYQKEKTKQGDLEREVVREAQKLFGREHIKTINDVETRIIAFNKEAQGSMSELISNEKMMRAIQASAELEDITEAYQRLQQLRKEVIGSIMHQGLHEAIQRGIRDYMGTYITETLPPSLSKNMRRGVQAHQQESIQKLVRYGLLKAKDAAILQEEVKIRVNEGNAQVAGMFGWFSKKPVAPRDKKKLEEIMSGVKQEDKASMGLFDRAKRWLGLSR